MNQTKRSKKRWNWKEKHLRKEKFSFKGIGWKALWYWERESYCLEDHNKRRSLEKVALHKVMLGWEEEEVYFPIKWRHRPDYFM